MYSFTEVVTNLPTRNRSIWGERSKTITELLTSGSDLSS